MNQNEFRKTHHAQSQNEKVLRYLRPGELVPMDELARVMGGFAVHSRIADLRKRGHVIKNYLQFDKVHRKTHSFYKLIH